LRLPNGEIYEGEWIVGTDIREGKGRLVYPDGKLYDGFFKENLRAIHGREIDINGAVIEGEF